MDKTLCGARIYAAGLFVLGVDRYAVTVAHSVAAVLNMPSAASFRSACPRLVALLHDATQVMRLPAAKGAFDWAGMFAAGVPRRQRAFAAEVHRDDGGRVHRDGLPPRRVDVAVHPPARGGPGGSSMTVTTLVLSARRLLPVQRSMAQSTKYLLGLIHWRLPPPPAPPGWSMFCSLDLSA